MLTKFSPHRISQKRQQGQTLTEFAMVLPLMALLLFGVIQFGIVFHQYVTLTDAVRGTPIASETSPKYAPGWRTPAAPRPPNLLAARTPESTT